MREFPGYGIQGVEDAETKNGEGERYEFETRGADRWGGTVRGDEMAFGYRE